MATAFTHAFVALAAGKAVFPEPMPKRFWALAMIVSAAPDLDSIGFRFGVEYLDVWGHRGMTHSIFFAAIIATLVVLLAFRREAPPGTRRFWILLAFFFGLTASHGVIDAFTDGGHGIALFAPFTHERYFMPWRPIAVSPISIRAFFSNWGARVMLSEILWIWVPVGVVCGVTVFGRSRRAGAKEPRS